MTMYTAKRYEKFGITLTLRGKLKIISLTLFNRSIIVSL